MVWREGMYPNWEDGLFAWHLYRCVSPNEFRGSLRRHFARVQLFGQKPKEGRVKRLLSPGHVKDRNLQEPSEAVQRPSRVLYQMKAMLGARREAA